MTQEPAPAQPQHLQYRTNAFGVTVVGFSTAYLQSEVEINKVAAELVDLIEKKGLTKLILTFQGVRFMSSSMLAQLVRLHKLLAKAGGKLRICCLSPTMMEVIHTSQLDKLLDVVADETAALHKF